MDDAARWAKEKWGKEVEEGVNGLPVRRPSRLAPPGSFSDYSQAQKQRRVTSAGRAGRSMFRKVSESNVCVEAVMGMQVRDTLLAQPLTPLSVAGLQGKPVLAL